MFIFEIKDDVVFLNGKIYFLFIIKEYVLLELNFVFEGISKLLRSWMLNLCNIFFFFQGSSGEEKEKVFKDELERWCSLVIIELVEGYMD